MRTIAQIGEACGRCLISDGRVFAHLLGCSLYGAPSTSVRFLGGLQLSDAIRFEIRVEVACSLVTHAFDFFAKVKGLQNAVLDVTNAWP